MLPAVGARRVACRMACFSSAVNGAVEYFRIDLRFSMTFSVSFILFSIPPPLFFWLAVLQANTSVILFDIIIFTFSLRQCE